MTTVQMLSEFRWRMDDPNAVKWDASSVDRIYAMFNTAQRMAVEFFVEGGKIKHLRELSDTKTASMSGGSFSLPSDFFKEVFLQDSDNSFIKLYPTPPENVVSRSSFKVEDAEFSYGYIFGDNVYLHGYDSGSGNHTLGYIEKPVDINGSSDPATSEYLQECVLFISEWLGWLADNQLERAQIAAQKVFIMFGITLGNKQNG